MKKVVSATLLCAVLLGLSYTAASPGQTKGVADQANKQPWDVPLEQLVPPDEDLAKVLPRLRDLRDSLERAATLKKVLDHLEQSAADDPAATADRVYEKLDLFRFPTPEQVSVAIERTKEPADILDQELFKAFDRDAGLVEVLGDPRLVKRFLQSKQVSDGVMRLSRRLSRRLDATPAGEALTLEYIAAGLGLDENATTLDLMEAATEVIEGSRSISLNVKIKDVPFTIRIPRKTRRAAPEKPAVDVINGEPVDLDGLLEPADPATAAPKNGENGAR